MVKLSKYITLAAVALLLANCADNQIGYGIPNLDGDCTTLVPTITLDELVTNATVANQTYSINSEEIFEGYVVSSDEGGNFYKTVSIVNTTNDKGLSISLDASGLFAKFEPGRKVFINLKDLIYHRATDYTIGINVGTTYPNDATRIGRIENYDIDKHVINSCQKIDENLLVKNLTITEAKNDQYLNQLIEIDAVQFTQASLGENYFSQALKPFQTATASNHEIADFFQNKLIVRVSEYANFASNPVATGSGKIRGVLTKYRNDYQFMIRTLNDVNFDEPRFEYYVPPTPPPTTSVLAFLGADFENWQDFLNSAGYNNNNTALAPFVPSTSLITQKVGQGIDGSNALGINGSLASNGNIFIVRPTGTNLPTNPTKISFWIKGTSTKTISINVFKSGGGNNYYIYNLENVNTVDKIITPSTANSYTNGSINTNNEWRLIQLDLSGLTDVNLDSTLNLLAFRLGNTVNYDILIDDITIE